MKSIIALLFVLTTSAAWANCPELTGSYTCVVNQGTIELEVAQAVDNNITTYLFTDSSGQYLFPADGVEHTYEDVENNQTGSLKIACENDGLSTYIKGQITDANKTVLESWDLLQTFKLDADKSMLVVTTGKQTMGDQQKPVNDSFVCKRK